MRGGHPNRGKNQNAYTIVEVMIFLAISGVMFVMAAAAVSGKQGTAEFKQGMNAANSDLRSVINDVNNGFYPSNNNFVCTTQNGPLQLVGPPSSNEQGTNQGCVFAGKVIQFAPDGDGTKYNVFTVVARQYKQNSSQNEVPTSLADAKPIAAYANGVDLTETNTIEWGLTVTKVITGSADPIPNRQLGGIAFMSSFGKYNTSNPGGLTGSSLNSENQNVFAVPISQGFGSSKDVMAQAINSTLSSDSNIDNNPNVIVCFDGGNGWFGTLTLGGAQGQRLTSQITISRTKDSLC